MMELDKINPEFYRAVSVVYDTNSNYNPNEKSDYKPPKQNNYTYLCYASLKPMVGNVLIVLTPHNGYQCVTVVEVLPKDHKLNPNIKYKWVIDKVNHTAYNKVMRK